jgi:lambda repressor-like predicted transcriptional regulator
MSVSSISSLTSTATSQVTGAAHHHGAKSPFDAVSSLLGMSAKDIASQVASGKSLDDLAKAKGVSHEDLVSALKASLPEDLKGSTQADAIAETIATQQGMPTQGPGGPPTAGPPPSGRPPMSSLNGIGQSSGVLSGNLTSSQQDMLDSLSSALGTDSTSLLDELRSGTSLSDLVKSKGIDSSTLANVLQNGLLVDTKA